MLWQGHVRLRRALAPMDSLLSVHQVPKQEGIRTSPAPMLDERGSLNPRTLPGFLVCRPRHIHPGGYWNSVSERSVACTVKPVHSDILAVRRALHLAVRRALEKRFIGLVAFHVGHVIPHRRMGVRYLYLLKRIAAIVPAHCLGGMYFLNHGR